MSWAIWITGVPGSGKSAIARAAVAVLAARGEFVQRLELDLLRRTLTPRPRYDDGERDAVYRALVVIARMLTQAGVPVIIDATAHRREWRDLARRTIPEFGEVQLLCPIDVARERERTRGAGHHPDAIYARAVEPGATVPGVNVPYEQALAPEVTIDTTRDTVENAAQQVAALARRLGRSRSPLPSAGGWTLWVTGAPGCGKTTVVSGVREHFRALGDHVAVLEPRDFVRSIAKGGEPSDNQRELITRAVVVAATLLNEAGVAVLIDGAPPLRAGLRLGRELIRHCARVELVCEPAIAYARASSVRWRVSEFPPSNGGLADPVTAVDSHEDPWDGSADLVLRTDAVGAWTSIDQVSRLADRLARLARQTPRVHRA